YGTANQPVCIGKKDERGDWLFPIKGALDPNEVAITIGDRLLARRSDDAIAMKVSRLKQAQHALAELQEVASRTPYFCSGCPHNSSTVVPEGMRAYAGIGCHFMAQWMDRNTSGYTHMGGEGANWIGEAPFSKRGHVFQNLGDGTYAHSGSMAIRAAIASGINITYKILYNDAVAMTGGQAAEGQLTVPQMAQQVAAEGVKRIAVVSDDPRKYPSGIDWPKGTSFHHRDDLNEVQREIADIPGTSVLIYDQTCAAEKRRRRKRGTFPDPDKRVIINELVCEGCGDCGVKSNCVSVQPLATEWGRKRTIDQSSCNKDYSCIKGFCPSFVTVHGGKPKRGRAVAEDGATSLPDPILPAIDQPFGIIVTGIGGTGIVTIGGVLGMAAHLEGKGVGIIDMAGLAQKGGAVYSHIRIANRPEDIHAIRMAAGGADLVLGGDIVVAGNKKVLAAVKHGSTKMMINTAEFLPGDFTRNADFSLPTERLKRAIIAAAGSDNVSFIAASRLATALLGNSIAANIFLVGYAYQMGALPLSAESIEKAIEMNGEAVAMNQAAFRWGRRAALDAAAVEQLIPSAASQDDNRRLSDSLDETVARRVEFLTQYQNADYAKRYSDFVAKVRHAETEKAKGRDGLTEAVARNLFKLMAYKDEYEVARLYTDGNFVKQVASTFEPGSLRFEFHLAPPLLARVDKATGEPRKMSFGPWIMRVFGVLAKLKGLRGTPFDLFGYSAERRTERKLIADYESLMSEVLGKLNADNHPLAVGLAVIPEKIRGFGPVKLRNLKAAKADEAALLEQFRSGSISLLKAAE
ncbi:MAG: indolepyruvate ferredoxin oxidoreductase family protein, partial [Pseudorhodoplanes sp.]